MTEFPRPRPPSRASLTACRARPSLGRSVARGPGACIFTAWETASTSYAMDVNGLPATVDAPGAAFDDWGTMVARYVQDRVPVRSHPGYELHAAVQIYVMNSTGQRRPADFADTAGTASPVTSRTHEQLSIPCVARWHEIAFASTRDTNPDYVMDPNGSRGAPHA